MISELSDIKRKRGANTLSITVVILKAQCLGPITMKNLQLSRVVARVARDEDGDMPGGPTKAPTPEIGPRPTFSPTASSF